jgi:hypothetical protein
MFNNIISKGKFTLALSLAIALFAVVGTGQSIIKTNSLYAPQKESLTTGIVNVLNINFLSCMGGVGGND